jgi:hypothetical protein
VSNCRGTERPTHDMPTLNPQECPLLERMPLRGRRITNTAFTGISIKEIPRLAAARWGSLWGSMPRQVSPAPRPVRIIGPAPQPTPPSIGRACILPHSLCTAGPRVEAGNLRRRGRRELRPPAPQPYSSEQQTPLVYEICAGPPSSQPPSFYRLATHRSHSAARGRVSLIVDLFTVLACSAAALQSECGLGYVWILYTHTHTQTHTLYMRGILMHIRVEESTHTHTHTHTLHELWR